MDYKKNKDVTDSSNIKAAEIDPNVDVSLSHGTEICIDDFSRPYEVLGTMMSDDKNDLKLKISKLEAYSRQLCLNLRDLQKNREEITNKTLALSEELDCSRYVNNNEDISSETDIHVLLHAKKSGCCTICKGYETSERDSNDTFEKEDTNDLPDEPLKDSSIEEIDVSECCCCICCENRITYEYFCPKCNVGETNFYSDSSTDVSPSYVNMQQSEETSQEETTVCCICSDVEETFAVGQCYKICGSERENNVEERCRGGVDRIEVSQHGINDVSPSTVVMKRERRMSESCESWDVGDLRDLSSGSPSFIAKCKLSEDIDKTDEIEEESIEKVQTSFRDEVISKFEQDSMIVSLAKLSQNDTITKKTHDYSINNNTLLDNRINEDPGARINEFDRSGLLRYLAAIDEISRGGQKNENTYAQKAYEDKTSTIDLLMGLLILFLIILSRASRYSTWSSLTYYFNSICSNFQHIFHRTIDEFYNLPEIIPKLMKFFNQQLTRESILNFRIYVNCFTSHVTLVGAIIVSITLTKGFWSFGGKLLPFLHKVFYFFYDYSWITRFGKSFKRIGIQIIFFTKSQYYFFHYLACLTIGFLVGKVSRIVEKWSILSSRSFEDNNLLLDNIR